MLKEAVTLSKQHCTTSFSALYQCIHGNGLFYHPKTAIVCADSPLRTENGRPLGAEVAHMQMMRMPTCRLNQHFFHGGGGLSCTPSVPTCSLNIPRSWCDPLNAGWQPPRCAPAASKRVSVYVPLFCGELRSWHVNKMPPLKCQSPGRAHVIITEA